MLALSLCCLSACGDETYTVDHVEFIYDWSTSSIDYEGNLIDLSASIRFSMIGQYNGSETKISFSDAFKDYDILDYTYEKTDADGHMIYEKIKEDALTMTCKLKGGITVTLRDEEGETHDLFIDSGSQFKVEKDGKKLRIKLPEDI